MLPSLKTGQFNGSKYVEELQGQHDILTECVEQLRTAESSRASLVSHLKEALQEQVDLLVAFVECMVLDC